MSCTKPTPVLTDSSRGWKLYEKAKRLIPGGTQLLSKRPELYLPQGWPCYYQRAKGCEIWDLDGNRFVDMTTSGIGACLLGYCDDDVNAAVKQAIDRGTMTTLNSPAEVELAEVLCGIHPWASAVRFVRTGGEAMAAAVRIARAHTARSKVAFCGYHGWNDWYLAANLSANHALDGHLLPGLSPSGVPAELTGTALPFRFNDLEQLQAIVNEHGADLAAIVMEPMRFTQPRPGFLESVRKLAIDSGAVLIFDEITSAWRHCHGGLHLSLGVNPDIAVFAKAISNGFPMGAIIGTRHVMEAAQASFISSTYWTESIGPTAALASIRKMGELEVSGRVRRTGALVQSGWQSLSEKHGLTIEVSGLPSLTSFSFNYGQCSNAIKTLFTQEMLDRGFLATTTFYPTLAHTTVMIQQYLEALDSSFAAVASAIEEGRVLNALRGSIVQSGFGRLT